MTKTYMWPNKNLKNWTKKKLCAKRCFLANIIVKLMAPAFKNTLTFNHHIINYMRICFLKLYNGVSPLPKKSPFPPFIDTKPFFTIKIANHIDHYTIGEMGWRRFNSLGFRYHQILILQLIFLQRCGTQVRVNTWTGSYTKM